MQGKGYSPDEGVVAAEEGICAVFNFFDGVISCSDYRRRQRGIFVDERMAVRWSPTMTHPLQSRSLDAGKVASSSRPQDCAVH